MWKVAKEPEAGHGITLEFWRLRSSIEYVPTVALHGDSLFIGWDCLRYSGISPVRAPVEA